MKFLAMPFNLLLDPFFPTLTRSGGRRWATFSELAALGDDEPVEFDWPRVDFNIAALELAIGVALMAFQPLRATDWLRLWNDQPGPDEAVEAIAPFAHAFALDGAGPRFLQELGGLEGETRPIESLLIDTPGDNGQKKNADVLTHRGRYSVLGLPAAAMALYTLQQYAPQGGRGNRTSLRGGGPLSTFVLPGVAGGRRPSLWRVVLANLPKPGKYVFEPEDLPKILPWLAPTMVSDKAHGKRLVSEGGPDAHPLQAFFGMPRRIALCFARRGRCAMTGETGPLVGRFTQRPSGVNYGVWEHPLTPYRRRKEGAEPDSVKPKSARFGYRDWTPVVVGATTGVLATPAENVRLARVDRRDILRGEADSAAALRAAGWAVDSMEAVAYLHAEQPLHLAENEDAQRALDTTAWSFSQAAEKVVATIVQALKVALFSEGAKLVTDKTLFEQARVAFYEATEEAFHDLLNDLASAPLEASEERARRWLGIMRRAAFSAFQASAPIPLDEPEQARPIADASRDLGLGLAGYGKAGRMLFEILELPPPDAGGPKRGKRNGG